MLDYKNIIIKHYALSLSGSEIARQLGASKSGVNDFLRAFDKCESLSYPLPPGITNYGIAELVYGSVPGSGGRNENIEYPDYEADAKLMATRKNMTLVFLWNNRSLDRAESILESCFKQEISILTKQDIRYPQRAKILKDAPVVLYYQGEMKDLDCMNTVGIVGARRCSQHIKKKCYELTEKYVEENKVIISGLAKVIDACAHTACINADGYTVAILGNGLDILCIERT